MKVIGIQNVDYVSKKTSNRVTGVRLHCSYERRDCEGVCVEQFFCKTSAFPDGVPQLGDEVDLLFNRYGNVQQVSFR